MEQTESENKTPITPPESHKMTPSTDTDSDKKTASANTESVCICALCMCVFSDKSELREHYNNVHRDSSLSKQTVQKRIVRKINRHLCNSCGKHFGDTWTLNHHQKTVHQSAREHVCGKCGKKFLSNKDMLRHVRGVHLGEKIIFPGGRGRKITSKFISEATKTIASKNPLDSRLVPNILKNSKADKKILMTPTLSNHQSNDSREPKRVVQVIGLEKPQDISEEPLESDAMIDLEDEVGFLPQEILGGSKPEDQPMFQLENLENLQLVVPEDSCEPRIIIPESGIKLTIQSDLGNSERKILHLIPDSSLPGPEDTSPLSPPVNVDSSNQAEIFQLFPVNEVQKDSCVSSEIDETPQMDSPKKFLYKKVSDSSSTHLVSVNHLDQKMDLNPVHQFKCEKCSKFFISKEFLDKHLLSTHTEIPPYNISILNSDIEDSQLANLEDIESIINFTNENDSSLLKAGCIDVLFSSTDTATSSGFQCKLCKESFDSRQQLQRHKKTSHKKQVTHKCEDCGAEFTSSQTLKSHIQTIHEGIKKVCSVCLKPVVDLTRHIRVQHKNGEKRNFQCDICDSKFR